MNARTLGSLSLVLLAILPVAASAQVAGPASSTPSIIVSGSASVSREPDVARVTISIETNADRAADATQENARLAGRVRAAIESLGIPAKSISTEFYNLRYQPRPEPTGTPQLRRPVGAPMNDAIRYGYVVTHGLTVTAKPNRVGTVIDAAIKAGATSVGGVSYDVSDRHAAYLEALRRAVADAASQARAVAAASGVHLGRILYVYAGGERTIAPPVPFAIRSEAAAGPIPTEIAPGAIRIYASVNVTYALAP